MSLLLIFFSTVPLNPLPDPPVELVVSKEGLAGKETEIVAADEKVPEGLPFSCKPELPIVVEEDLSADNKLKKVHKPPKTNLVRSKISTAHYNRRGNRNK